MKAVYRLPIRQGIVIPVPDGVSSISFRDTDSFGNTKVNWKVNSEGNLEFVELNISGAQIQRAPNGAILSSYPELEEFAFRVIAYVANSILIQTGVDAIDLANVLHRTPEIFPETPDEEEEFAKNPKRTVGSSLTVDAIIRGKFQPIEYPTGFAHSAAVANYADGLRVSSPFQQYEQFYKVIEHFFAEKGESLDVAVSNHASQHDSRYNQTQIGKLRRLRNRCVHPKAHGHVNPEDVASVREVKSALPIMRDLAYLLLCHPPT